MYEILEDGVWSDGGEQTSGHHKCEYRRCRWRCAKGKGLVLRQNLGDRAETRGGVPGTKLHVSATRRLCCHALCIFIFLIHKIEFPKGLEGHYRRSLPDYNRTAIKAEFVISFLNRAENKIPEAACNKVSAANKVWIW